MKQARHKVKSIPVRATDFDANDINLLEISRLYFAEFAANRTPDCEAAAWLRRKSFGENNAVEIAVSLLNVICAMRASRKTTFHFNNQCCFKCKHRVTECERLLVETIKYRRKRHLQKSYVPAMMLCEGNDMDQFFMRIDRLNKWMVEPMDG